jgi:hypothetical protein
VGEHVENWNDYRIGDLGKDVKDGFEKVGREMKDGFEHLEGQMKENSATADAQIKEAEGRSVARMDRLESRLEKLQYWIWGIGATLVVGVITHFA